MLNSLAHIHAKSYKILYVSNNVAILVILIENHVLSVFHIIFFLFNRNGEVYPDELKSQFI